MEITEQKLKRVMQESLGEDVLPITLLLKKNEELSELKLANILKIEVNETRRILYKLHHQNLVSFKKKKDEESGWYTYYWKLNQNHMSKMVDDVSASLIDKFTKLLERETNTQFFFCEDRCVRLDQDSALSFNFKCPECGQVLKLEDNSRRIEYIQKTLFDMKRLFDIQQNS